MDAPNGLSAIKVQSAHHKLAAHMTIAVLVKCERKLQYFPNLDVAKSVAAAPTWRGHQARVIDGSGNLNLKITVPKVAHMVQPPHFEGPNVAVETLFGIWDSFRTSKTVWRPNPEMPRGDVTPKGCIRTLMVKQLNDPRPVKSVPPTRPLNPKVKPAASHVDQAAFPALSPSSNEGIGGIPGTKDFPVGTTKGFQAFKKPDKSTVVPCPVPGKTVALPTTTTTETTPSPAVPTAVVTTTTTTTSATSSPSIVRKTTLEPKVTVTQMSPQVMGDACAKLAGKADPNQSGQGKTSSKDSSTEESMDFETTHVSRHRSSSHVRTFRSRSQSSTRDKERKGAEGKSSSAQAPPKSKEPTKKSSHLGSTTASEMLLKAGGVKPPGKDVGPKPKYTPGKEYKVDYSKEPCPPPAFQLDQPGGCHLEGASEQPKSTWHADPNMSQATLQGHLQALAQAGSRHALFRSQQGMLRTRMETMHVSKDTFQQIAREPVFVDEGHAGVMLASHHELQRCNTTMKADLKAAHKNLVTACQNT